MKNEITVKDLVDMLDNSIGHKLAGKDLAKATLFDSFCNFIKGLMAPVDKDTTTINIDNDYLKVLKSANDFDRFLVSNSYYEVDKKLAVIKSKLEDWKLHSIDVSEYKEIGSLNKKKGRFGKFIVGSILAVTILCGSFLIYSVFHDETLFSKLIGTILTVLDAILGIAFFLYEFISDNKQKDISAKADQDRNDEMTKRTAPVFEINFYDTVEKVENICGNRTNEGE